LESEKKGRALGRCLGEHEGGIPSFCNTRPETIVAGGVASLLIHINHRSEVRGAGRIRIALRTPGIAPFFLGVLTKGAAQRKVLVA
jgi:hypothetical protein